MAGRTGAVTVVELPPPATKVQTPLFEAYPDAQTHSVLWALRTRLSLGEQLMQAIPPML